jgi:hypothetical protein
MTKKEKIDNLRELLNVVYHAEGMIDGEHNPMAYEDMEELNEYYEFSLSTLTNLMSFIRTQIKWEEGKK